MPPDPVGAVHNSCRPVGTVAIGGTKDDHMLLKKLLAAFAVAALMFGAAACGGDDDDSAADKVTDAKEETEDAADKAADEVEEEVEDADSTDEDTDITDIDDVDFEGLGDCFEISMAYASVYFAVLGDEDAMKEALGQLEEMSVQVPDSVKDDFEVLIEGFSEANGLIEVGEFMETDEYTEADENISAFLEETCG